LIQWTLAEFVRHKTVDQVWLAPPCEEWPDGYVRLGKKTENVEVTIALTEGRRMGDEYRPGSPTLTHDPVENWVERANGIPDALEKAITRKLEKRYGSGMWLVVYLNISERGIRQAKIECAIAKIRQRHGQSFGGLFVIWKDKLL
jgi:hypothetical protein